MLFSFYVLFVLIDDQNVVRISEEMDVFGLDIFEMFRFQEFQKKTG